MKVGIIIGTRPEIIKMAPIIRECQNRKIPYFIIHSNQHYSADMDAVFFEELELPPPHYNLHVGSGQHSNQTGNILIKMEPILENEKPDVVLVQGDTNTVLAGALAASKLNIKVGHIEAGLRSYDRTMPEETNRILTDHISEFLFSVSDTQSSILFNEGIDKKKIFQVGNTISDSLLQHIPLAEECSDVLSKLKITPNDYILVTAHRASNVDIHSHLEELVDTINSVADKYNKTIVWPIHPRTKKKVEEHNIQLGNNIILTPPLGYLDFIKLQKNAFVIMTDSGGIQEEACMLRIPCITLRENTERPETIEVGANILVGRNKNKTIAAMDNWLSLSEYNWENPFGDGKVSKAIVDILEIRYKDKPTVIEEKSETVSVIGLGYMGLPISCLISQGGYRTTGIDINKEKVNRINQGHCPFEEPGLPELLSKSLSTRFKASTHLESSDIYLIAVPTPHINSSCDLSYVNSALDAIAKVAKDGQLVIIESTISPQTCIKAQKRLKDVGLIVDVIHCPERAIPGLTLYELTHNDRIIGAPSTESSQKAKRLYQSFVQGEIFETDTVTAECVKLVENTSRDVNIAFANELASISDELCVNVHEVIKLANRHPRVNILTPGPGVGGHCIPIDPWFLVENTKAGDFVRHARKVNDERPNQIAQIAIDKLAEIGGKKVVLLGVAYKPNVDDCRETPAKAILEALQIAGAEVKYHDPHVPVWSCKRIKSLGEVDNWADLVLMVTTHDEYSFLSLKTPTLNNCGKQTNH